MSYLTAEEHTELSSEVEILNENKGETSKSTVVDYINRKFL